MSTLHRQELTAEPGVTSRDGPDQTAQKKKIHLRPPRTFAYFCAGEERSRSLSCRRDGLPRRFPAARQSNVHLLCPRGAFGSRPGAEWFLTPKRASRAKKSTASKSQWPVQGRCKGLVALLACSDPRWHNYLQASLSGPSAVGSWMP